MKFSFLMSRSQSPVMRAVSWCTCVNVPNDRCGVTFRSGESVVYVSMKMKAAKY